MDSNAKHPRLATAGLAVALAFVASLSMAACTAGSGSPTGSTTTASSSTAPSGGTEATTQVCADIVTSSKAAVAPLLPLLSGSLSASQIQADLPQIKAAATTWATALQAEASKAQDPTIATGLQTAATQINAAVSSQLSSDSMTPTQLQAALTSLLTAASGLYASCPNLASIAQ
jgi:hypothetical protein